jgi:threonine/homoserine/homoserine lactone efflux protein
METFLEGIVLGLSITAPIGPTNIEVIRRGLKHGWKSAAAFCLGVETALILYLLLVLSGLSFLTESEIFTTVLLTIGTIVLFHLAYGAARDFFKKEEIDLSCKAASGRQFLPGLGLTISNPAVLLLWTGIMGASLSAGVSHPQGRLLAIGILAGVSIFFTFLTSVIHWGKRFVSGRNFRYVSLAASLVLLSFGVKFGHQLIMNVGAE